MHPEKTFGQRLKLYRQALDLTQADLAEMVGCATESIRKMEANRQRPSKFLAARLADNLAISTEERTEFLSMARHVETRAGQDSHVPTSLPPAINLPAQMTTLVGRQKELATACKLLRKPDVRLITLTGPGGVGKTRLAGQIAREMHQEFQDGVFFVPLASITDASLVAQAIAQALHLRTTSGQFSVHFGSRFRYKHILLVLDNFEHVLAAAPLVAGLLQAAEHLRILITSRSTLNLYGEHELNVQPLSTPDLGSLPNWRQLVQYDSVRIFLDRTRALKADFELTEANAMAIAEICYRLDGLPLALELAAAYGKLLSPSMLLEHIKKGPIDLSSARSNIPERHFTLRNTMHWSYQLLDPVEQEVFQRLSVFIGGFTIESAEAVCALQPEATIKTITALLDKSLLQQVDDKPDGRRFVMLETIRAYAREQLRLAGQDEETFRRHLAYFLDFAHEIARNLLIGPGQRKRLDRLIQEIGNLRVAIQWAIHQRVGEAVVRLCSDLEYFWYEFGDPDEIHQWIDTVLTGDMNLSSRVKASALRFTGFVHTAMQIDYPRAQRFYNDALQLWQELGDRPEIADTLARLGIVELELGNHERSRTLYEECLRIWESLGDSRGMHWSREWLAVIWMRQGHAQKAQKVFEESAKWHHQQDDIQSEAFSLNNLGAAALYLGNYDLAHICHERALILWEAIGDTRGKSSALNALGPVALHRGNPVEARAILCQSLSLRWENQDYNGIAWNLERLAEVALAQQEVERGAQLWGAAETLREKYNSPLFPAERHRYEPVLAEVRRQLGEVAWEAYCAMGRAKALEEIVDYALEK